MKKLFACAALGAILASGGAFAYGGGPRDGEGASRPAARSQTQASGAPRDRAFREADAVGHYNGPRDPFLKRYTYD
ncbi:hypothetical protein [Methylocella silvestris]|uniref:Uncharacterized protein n=1 Tax=Methylocella silvestris TaxID=199596 RepID=A0A2J7TIB7_METSI|nr:hypothetical protein [Methylocella silvestris]PNG26521.1 hypothetical protein CR492_07440 [Methylocella silvestris]